MLPSQSFPCFLHPLANLLLQQSFHNSTAESPLKRRNSAKGPNPLVTSASVTTNIQRSKSLLTVNQTADSDLSSPFHSPVKSRTGTSAQYSTNLSHVPVIMRATTNGAVTKPLKTASSNTVRDGDKLVGGPKSSVNSGKENELSSAKGGVEAKVVSGFNDKIDSLEDNMDRGGLSNRVPAGGSASGGLYVKRNPVQQQRVTTTANISSSKFLPLSQPPSSPGSEPGPVTAFPSTTSSTLAASATPSHSHHPAAAPSISSVAKSKPLVSQASYVSPLQMAQARKGISKSQNISTDTNSESQGYRILPSVKLLAQSFGSNTALNVVPASNTHSNGNRSGVFSGGVYRSNSSLNLSEPQSSVSTTRIILTKGSAAGAVEQTPQQEAAVFINGRPQQPFSVQLNRVPQSTVPSNISNEPNELEQMRTKLRSVGRELDYGGVKESGNSAVVAPVTSHSVRTVLEDEVDARDNKSAESSRIGTYVKKKDSAPGKPPSNAQSASSQSVTVRSVNSSSVLATTKMGNPSQLTGPQSLSQKASVAQQSHEPYVSNSTSFQKQGHEAVKRSALVHDQTESQSVQRQQGQPAYISSSNSSTSFATLPPKRSTPGDRTVSPAAVTIRRAKSREELQEIENEARTKKDLLLKQIQAKRKDQESGGGGGGGSNISSMGKLSQSMPSLLLEGK